MTNKELLQDIKDHPENHRHKNLDELQNCCTDNNGVVHIHLIDAHSRFAPQGINGGVACDVSEGPCSCGAWH